MEKSEPSLVPEWLKSSGSVTGVGTLRPHSSSSFHSDDHPGSKLTRNKSSSRSIDQDFVRSSSSERISLSFSRRSYSSNDSAHSVAYSNFGRNYRGREWEKDINEYQDKNRKAFGVHKEKDVSPRSMFSGRFEKDGIRHSQSMISGRRSEVWPKKPSGGSTVANLKCDAGANGPIQKDGYVGSTPKAALEKDFPPLGSEERQDAPEIGRVPSPGLSSSFHHLQSGISAFNNGNKWISALAEAPAVVEGSDASISSGQGSFSGSSARSLSTTTGLNMAEAVALGPLRSQSAPQVSTGSQRLEELAIKQCRQLIPVTPAIQKPSIMNFDKVKGGKLGQPQHLTSSPLVSPSVRGGTVKADVLKTGNTGKLQVLKPARENNVAPSGVKDSYNSTDSKTVSAPVAASSSIVAGSSVSKRPTSSSISPTPQRKHELTVSEKRPTSQAQSRHDFFNLMRKKSLTNSSVVSDGQPGHTVSSTSIQINPGDVEVALAPATTKESNIPSLDNQNGSGLEENQGSLLCNGKAFHADEHPKNGKTSSSPSLIFSEEEEAAFLRSLGWDESYDEDVLTDEEISAFYRDVTKYVNSRPSLKHFEGVEQHRFTLPVGSQAGTVGDAVSSRLGSSNLKLES